jgi:sensor histidine kinase YesM
VAFTILKDLLIQPPSRGIVSFNGGEEFFFEGLTISYPNGWRAESEVIMDNIAFFVNLDKPDPESSDQVTITWFRNTENSLEEMVESAIGAYRARFKRTEFTSLYTSTFKGVKCVATDFMAIYSLGSYDEQFYGNITSFVMNENTVIIAKLSDSKGKLSDENFRLMEESFVVR